MLYCAGHDCPLKSDCYRHTQPTPNRDRLAALPYNAATTSCEFFHSNQPSEEVIREAAYYRWLQQGRPTHREREIWNEAYHQLCISTGRHPPD